MGSSTQEQRRISSTIEYRINTNPGQRQWKEPRELGRGRYAKVLEASMYGDSHFIKHVAVKILHVNAKLQDQRLFETEIDLMRTIADRPNANVVALLDVVELPPMVMCGCGVIYWPQCPECKRRRSRTARLRPGIAENRPFPCLECGEPGCDFRLDGEQAVADYNQRQITGPDAKPCCQSGPTADIGSVVNFVTRKAMVLDVLRASLHDHVAGQWRRLEQRCKHFGVPEPRPWDPQQYPATDPEDIVNSKIWTLDKLQLMVRIGETLAWLHSDSMKIVHKDITPDNVMIRTQRDDIDEPPLPEGEAPSLRGVLRDLVGCSDVGIRFIDFGLADRFEPTTRWYDEQDMQGQRIEKRDYFSPEAQARIDLINTFLRIDRKLKRFLIPERLWRAPCSVTRGDVISFTGDAVHKNDLHIVGIVQEGAEVFAQYQGEPPESDQQHFKLVRHLGVAHDVYCVGTVFYYLLTEGDERLGSLRAFAELLQTFNAELTASWMESRVTMQYRHLRDSLRILDVTWRDRLMELVMNAMVRGRPQSCNGSRDEQNDDGSVKLLAKTKRLYNQLQEEVLSYGAVAVAYGQHQEAQRRLVYERGALEQQLKWRLLAGLLAGAAGGGGLVVTATLLRGLLRWP